MLPVLILLLVAVPGASAGACRHGSLRVVPTCLLAFAALQMVADGWVLMSQDGTLTFVAPIEIDAAWGNSRLTFKESRQPRWDIYNDDNNYLRISELSQNVHHIVFTPNPINTISIYDTVQFASAPSVTGELEFGSSLSVRSHACMGFPTFTFSFAHLEFPTLSHRAARVEFAVPQLGMSRAGLPLTVCDSLHLSSSLALRSPAHAGLASLASEPANPGSVSPSRRSARLGSPSLVLNCAHGGSTLTLHQTARPSTILFAAGSISASFLLFSRCVT